MHELQGKVPETLVTGQTADISPFCEIGFYNWVLYLDPTGGFPRDKQVLGWWLGPAIDIRPAMTAKIIKASKQVLHLLTYWALTDNKWQDPKLIKAQKDCIELLQGKLGKLLKVDTLGALDPEAVTPDFEDYKVEQSNTDVADNEPTLKDLNNCVGVELLLPQDNQMISGKVVRQARGLDQQPIGRANRNAILDTQVYDVKFPDGRTVQYVANIIAKNMYAQYDPDGNQYQLMEEIVDHKTNGTAVDYADRFVIVNGRQYQHKMTAGWKLCVKWKALDYSLALSSSCSFHFFVRPLSWSLKQTQSSHNKSHCLGRSVHNTKYIHLDFSPFCSLVMKDLHCLGFQGENWLVLSWHEKILKLEKVENCEFCLQESSYLSTWDVEFGEVMTFPDSFPSSKNTSKLFQTQKRLQTFPNSSFS